MFSNIFLNPNPGTEKPRPPARLYARIDQVEERQVLFDAVSADSFDELPDSIKGIEGWANHSERTPVFALALEVESNAPTVLADLLDNIDHWYEITLEAGGANAILYFNLFRDGARIGVTSIARPSPAREQQLFQAFSLTGLERTDSELKNVLNGVSAPIHWVGVYDVGQGNANAACDDTETPLLYFDLGGGVLGHRNSFPVAMSDFCYKVDPVVVLSHWDWDHWSSGARFSGAQNLKWVVPLQKLGGVHATFAAGLHSNGKLFVWRSGLPSVTNRQVTVRKCSGQGAGRNHTGLAVEVAGPTNEEPILLTGDARYSAIPGAASSTFTSLVVPHHGANMRSGTIPPGHHLAGSRTAYSFAITNNYGHPDPLTQKQHHNSNWPQSSQLANAPIDRCTSARPNGNLGHIGLSWQSNPVLPGHNCGVGGCAVKLQQT